MLMGAVSLHRRQCTPVRPSYKAAANQAQLAPCILDLQSETLSCLAEPELGSVCTFCGPAAYQAQPCVLTFQTLNFPQPCRCCPAGHPSCALCLGFAVGDPQLLGRA